MDSRRQGVKAPLGNSPGYGHAWLVNQAGWVAWLFSIVVSRGEGREWRSDVYISLR